MNGFVNWLTGTPWSIALHESLYMYSLTESVHVMAIMVFVGTIAMIDLRVLGVAYKDAPMSQMLSRILPWTAGGFAVLVIHNPNRLRRPKGGTGEPPGWSMGISLIELLPPCPAPGCPLKTRPPSHQKCPVAP